MCATTPRPRAFIPNIQLRVCHLKVSRLLWLKDQFISHKSSFSWTLAINTMMPVPTVEARGNIAKLPASWFPGRNGVIPLIWFGCLLTPPCGTVSADCSKVHYSHLPLLCVRTLVNTVITVTPMSGSSLLQGNSWCSCQIGSLLDDNLLHCYETFMTSTLQSHSHQGGISTGTWESPAISICWSYYYVIASGMTLTDNCWQCILLSIMDRSPRVTTGFS